MEGYFQSFWLHMPVLMEESNPVFLKGKWTMDRDNVFTDLQHISVVYDVTTKPLVQTVTSFLSSCAAKDLRVKTHHLNFFFWPDWSLKPSSQDRNSPVSIGHPIWALQRLYNLELTVCRKGYAHIRAFPAPIPTSVMKNHISGAALETPRKNWLPKGETSISPNACMELLSTCIEGSWDFCLFL